MLFKVIKNTIAETFLEGIWKESSVKRNEYFWRFRLGEQYDVRFF